MFDRIDGFSHSLTKLVNNVGVFALAIMMLLTAVDVFSRFFFNLPVTGSIEGTEFLLVLTIFLAIPYAAATEQHITIDALVNRLGKKTGTALKNITLFIALILFAVLVWRSIEYAILMSTMNRVTAVLQLPIAPFVLVVTFGCLLFFFVLLVDLSRNLLRNIKNWK